MLKTMLRHLQEPSDLKPVQVDYNTNKYATER